MAELDVLFYTGSKNKENERLYSLADIVSLSARTRVFQSIDDFSRRLSQPVSDGPAVAVLLAANKEDLRKIATIHHLLSDMGFILILPDRKPETVRMGYTLAPRFLTSVEDGMGEVAAVLGRMIENYQRNEEDEIANGRIKGFRDGLDC